MKISCLDSLLKIAEDEENHSQQIYSPGEAERYFFNEIATPNKMKYTGSPEGANYSGAKDRKDFFMDIPTYSYADVLKSDEFKNYGAGFFSTKWDEPRVVFRRNGSPSDFVHEHTHHRTIPNGEEIPTPDMDPNYLKRVPITQIPWWNHLVPWPTRDEETVQREKDFNKAVDSKITRNPAGIPYKQWNDLSEIYGLEYEEGPESFFPEGYDYRIEAPSIHAERQLEHMMRYADQNGTFPTADQLDEYFANIPRADLKKDLLYGEGGHADHVRKKERAADLARYEAAKADYETKHTEWADKLEALDKRNGSLGKDLDPVEVLRPGSDSNYEWSAPISVEDARDTDWYKEDPEFFESLFNEEDAAAIRERAESGLGFSFGVGEDGNLVLWPRTVLSQKYYDDIENLRKEEPKEPQLEDYQTGEDVPDEDAERYRDALRHNWSKNDGVKNYNIV